MPQRKIPGRDQPNKADSPRRHVPVPERPRMCPRCHSLEVRVQRTVWLHGTPRYVPETKVTYPDTVRRYCECQACGQGFATWSPGDFERKIGLNPGESSTG